ncbi:hypothetical protein L596_001653 [Steinernema carpocapsae]|uniref:Uncharacterized protein n=1 Tax=Steinernema carpocapsae TaxID=34508 RepID=A0A4U8ULP3_STECR|nr:hypothetical protein L596_001653 [Steinernema carpocapsae]
MREKSVVPLQTMKKTRNKLDMKFERIVLLGAAPGTGGTERRGLGFQDGIQKSRDQKSKRRVTRLGTLTCLLWVSVL